MDKKTWNKILLSCFCFLGLVAISSYFVHKQDHPVSKQSTHKIMYLTFDDGPSQHTQEVLDILKKYNAKATFFVTGEKKEYEYLIKEEYKQGHAIGIHTFSHDYGKIYSSPEAYFKDIEKMNDVIEKQIGHKVNILRFPGGSSNTVSRKYCDGIMTQLTKDVLDKGYQYYDWNASNGDGNSNLSVSTLVDTGQKEVGEQEVVMVLMHDGAGSEETVKALPSLLEYYQKQGYEFRIIDDSTPEFHHHVNN